MVLKTISIRAYAQFLKATVLFLSLVIYAQSSYAAVPNAADMLANLTNSVPNLMRFVTALAYVMGMYLIFKGILGLKQYGEQRTMMSSSHDLKGPILMMIVGTALLYLPSSVQVGLDTFWNNANPYAYVTQATDQWSTVIQDGFIIIQLIGTISFIRGLVILTHLGGQGGGQPGTFGRALAHIIAGILCINLTGFLDIVNNTFALGQT